MYPHFGFKSIFSYELQELTNNKDWEDTQGSNLTGIDMSIILLRFQMFSFIQTIFKNN